MGAGFSHQDGHALLTEMDKTISQKVAICAAHMMLEDGATVLDAGCANGSATAYFALKYPNVHVVGVDYDPSYIAQARQKYGAIPNLEFIEADLTKLDMKGRKLDAVLNLSILHEPFSYTGYRARSVEEIIEAELRNLKQGGVVINRDFMLPEDPDKQVYIVLSDDEQHDGDDYEALSDAAFFERYAREAMSFDNGNPDGHIKGFFYEDVTQDIAGQIKAPTTARVFALPHQFAWEFAWRNQYRKRFENEAEEKYAFWTHRQHREIPKALGARVLYSAPYENPWILENWYKPHIALYDENLNDLPLPPSNFISVYQKKGNDGVEAVTYREHMASTQTPCYLTLHSYVNRYNGNVFDMIARPGGDVIDVLPFGYDDNDELTILAKDGYPRPLANLMPRANVPRLDGKFWSGHMIEPIAAANIDGNEKEALKTLLAQRIGIKSDVLNFDNVIGQYYYPAAAELNERVHSLCVEIKDLPQTPLPMAEGYSGFTASGVTRCFNAQSLLQAVQAGMLPEARLETNIYTLMRSEGVHPKEWFGQAITLQSVNGIIKTPIEKLFTKEQDYSVFEQSKRRSNWLKIKRSVFHEVAHEDGRDILLSAKDIEFVMPHYGVSTNSAMVVALVQDGAGDVLIGVRKISAVASQFASVQQREGHSGMISLPSVRLPAHVKHIQNVGCEIAQKWDMEQSHIFGLGEGYFPSLGVMPHRVYPFVVTKPSEAFVAECDFISLRDAFTHAENIEDLHLLNAIYRSVHALGLWEAYSQDTPVNKGVQNKKNRLTL